MERYLHMCSTLMRHSTDLGARLGRSMKPCTEVMTLRQYIKILEEISGLPVISNGPTMDDFLVFEPVLSDLSEGSVYSANISHPSPPCSFSFCPPCYNSYQSLQVKVDDSKWCNILRRKPRSSNSPHCSRLASPPNASGISVINVHHASTHIMPLPLIGWTQYLDERLHGGQEPLSPVLVGVDVHVRVD